VQACYIDLSAVIVVTYHQGSTCRSSNLQETTMLNLKKKISADFLQNASHYHRIIMAALTMVMFIIYYVSLLFLSSFFFQIPHPIATKLSHMLGSECDLRKWVRNLGPLTKTRKFRTGFWTTSRLEGE